MISDVARAEVWQSILEANRMCRYYEVIHSRNVHLFFVTRFLTLALISGGAAALLDVVPYTEGIVPKAIIVTLAIMLTIWDAIANYQKKAAIAYVVKMHSARVRARLQCIWIDVENNRISESELQPKIRDISLELSEIEGMAGAGDLPVNHRINKKTTRDAYEFAKSRYGVRA